MPSESSTVKEILLMKSAALFSFSCVFHPHVLRYIAFVLIQKLVDGLLAISSLKNKKQKKITSMHWYWWVFFPLLNCFWEETDNKMIRFMYNAFWLPSKLWDGNMKILISELPSDLLKNIWNIYLSMIYWMGFLTLVILIK